MLMASKPIGVSTLDWISRAAGRQTAIMDISSFWATHVRRFISFNHNVMWIQIAFRSSCYSNLPEETKSEVNRITKFINDHPFPDTHLQPTLSRHVHHSTLSVSLVENVLGRLFASHGNGLKAYEFFKFSLKFPHVEPTSDSFEKTLHILARMRYFDKAWELMEEIGRGYPSLLTLKSMSIMLSRIAKFQSYEETLGAFKKMEKDIYAGRKFGTDEFNVLLHAFCTQRQMKEARSIFHKMHHRNIKSAMLLMDEMEQKQIEADGMTYHTLFHGLMKSSSLDGVAVLYQRMISRNFAPKTRTVVMLMKFFCQNGHVDIGLNLWNYLVGKGFCPHEHSLALLVTSLCSHGRVQEAFECSRQMLHIGRHMSDPVFRLLERSLRQSGQEEKLTTLHGMIKRLQSVYPVSREHAVALDTPC